MRKLFVFSLVVVMLTALAAPVGANSGQAKELPFKGTMSGDEVTFNLEVPDGRCLEMAAVADSVTMFAGTGHATHLGRVDFVAEHCSDLDTGRYGDGMLTIIAANGDILKATYTNGVSLTPAPLIDFTDDFTFVDGGTGRFGSASGGGTERGVFDVTTNEFSVRMEGFISYDASNRRD